MKKKLLILVVAYNHEKFIEKVLERIDDSLSNIYDTEILINDDSSSDDTLEIIKNYTNNSNRKFKYTILSNPINLGYGGNQKIGFLYAIKNNFDYVALVHGDGQYAPEYLEQLIKPFEDEKIDAVFGSRMITKNGALNGGMPFYKFIGNKILTYYQNLMFSERFSEFHSGYRVYKVNSLKKIPYNLNNNDHSFDNEIIIQCLLSNFNIKEVPIPTYYGDEISYVNGLKYAFQVFIANLKAKLQNYGIFYDRKFDIKKKNKNNYKLKDKFDSPHKKVIDRIKNNSNILDLGCNDFSLGNELKKIKNCKITSVDINPIEGNYENFIRHDLNSSLPNLDYQKFDYILLLDVIEHLDNPEKFMKNLKEKVERNEKLKLIVSTPNVAFFIIRLMLLFGNFNYGQRGILDKTHKRLFTFKSFQKLIFQSSFKFQFLTGIPAPYPLAIGENFLSKLLISINKFLILLSKNLFSFQIYSEIKPETSIELLLEKAKDKANE